MRDDAVELLRVEMKTMLFDDLQNRLDKIVIYATDEKGTAREGGEWCYGVGLRVLEGSHRENVLACKCWYYCVFPCFPMMVVMRLVATAPTPNDDVTVPTMICTGAKVVACGWILRPLSRQKKKKGSQSRQLRQSGRDHGA